MPRQQSSRPSLKAVAERAGVGYGTASRSLSGSGPVAPETRQRVLDAAEALGYVPNMLGRALRRQRTTFIGLVLPDLGNEYYTEALDTIHHALAAAGYQMITVADATATGQDALVSSLAQQQVAGIIQVPVVGASVVTGLPVVQFNRSELGAGVPCVLCDDEDGFRRLAELVMHHGYRDIAVLLGDSAMSTTVARAAGVQGAVSGTDARVRYCYGSYTADSGREMMEELLNASDGSERPDAVIVASPRLMAGVAAVLGAREMSFPGDIAVAAFDDPEWYRLLGPGITTFDAPQRQMGRAAVAMVLDMIESGEPPSNPVQVIPGSVRERGSL
ncbi:Transcriptional regulator, LacI-family [Corynebacterium glyciniphilum AJ 3170]|uniref:Transcriptional regulator, LacI-family n=1 Tax=Corynebacterium glyciniphilum AJ 3170 TaxID=1404245 RepID=X5EBA5_9CORY|nr:LacI family DNA-binding transcriptional regulator [Corynebacterium glyciniphilum]AHW63906.1 Transcriptional regulator, LacI-family [Corynebacterium glyciniphilum AJ 3170]